MRPNPADRYPFELHRDKIIVLLTYVFWLAAAIFLGRFELHTDDTGVEVFLILLFAFLLGWWCPKRAWLASLLGLSAPFAQLFWGQSPFNANHAKDLAIIAGLVAIVGAVGSYSGVLLRKLVTDH